MGLSRAQILYPSDINDLDIYILQRNRRIDYQQQHQDRRPPPATVALDRHMGRTAQGELLGKLMDFQRNINAYIMGVNNVSMSTHGPDDRIFRLFYSSNRGDKNNQQLFENSLNALANATDVLNETIAAVEETNKGIEDSNRKAREMQEKIEEREKKLDKHMQNKDKEERAMHDERSRVKRLELYLKKQMQELERDRERMEKERLAYMNEAREKAREARVARLESAQMCAQSKGDAQSEVEAMKTYVLEQERLRIEAENEAREAKRKSSFLADRNKLLSDKLSVTRGELRRLQGGKAKKGQPAVKLEHPAVKDEYDTQWDHKGKKREASQMDDDGFIETGFRPGLTYSDDELDSQDVSGSSSTMHQSLNGRLTHQTSRSKDFGDDSEITIIDTDTDAGFDDRNYFMPGFHENTHPSSTTASSRRPLTTRTISGDDSVEYVGEKRRRISDPANNNNDGLIQSVLNSARLQYGPRHRFRQA
ncbi:hypothetical protein CBS101457_005142 [Exobasidium rhododendri]|nr:hypothetical protein CBS101457_005142 [Exobasidium rhododendri]